MKIRGKGKAGSGGEAGSIQPRMSPSVRGRRWSPALRVAAVGAALIAMAGAATVLLRDSGDSLENTLSRAQAALATGDYAEAADRFKMVLDNDPRNVEALEGLLRVAWRQVEAWNYGHAIAYFEKVLEVDPDNVEALKGLGEAYESQEEWQQAVSWYEKWMQVASDDVDALSALGWGEYRLEHYVNAEAYFKRAREVTPDHVSSLLGLGRVYYAQGDYVRSLSLAEKAVGLAPDGSEEQVQVMQLLKELAWVSLDMERLLVLSRRYAEQGNDAALQQISQWIVEQIHHPRDVNLGDRIRFLGYELEDLSGDQVRIDLYFQALAPMDADYTVWLHARVDEQDVGLLPPDRQQHGFVSWDHGMTYPTSRWAEGAVYRDRTVRKVAPGQYNFQFGVWLPGEKARLTRDGDQSGAVELGWYAIGGE